jgi:type II secretory pathway component GspD/PulD (secretin)
MLAGLTAGWFGVAATAVAQPIVSTPAQPPVPGAAMPAQAPPDEAAVPPGTNATGQPGDLSATPATGKEGGESASADQTNAAPPVVVEATATGAEGTHTNATAGVADQGLIPNIRGANADMVLNYLAQSAGMTIIRQADTHLAVGTVDIVGQTPLSKEEIIVLLNKILAQNNLTALKDGNTLTIETVESATTDAHTPVYVWSGDYETVPNDSRVGTYVILLHSLNPVEVLKDLLPLRPVSGAEMMSNPGGNAIIMTARNSDVRHFCQIIAALDSSGNGDLEVFLLTYADSKALAQELKDVFSPTDAGAGGGGGGGLATLFGGGRGGRGGGGAANPDDPKRAAFHVNAVSDDENNAVMVSAPIDIMPGISNLITKLDIPQDDMVLIKVFPLKHANPDDVATELTSLFPDPNAQNNQQTGGRAGRGGATVAGRGGRAGGGGAVTPGAGMSDRMKKQITVNAVADERTQSVLVTASKDTMVEVEKMIDQLDESDAHTMEVFAFRPANMDVTDLQQALQDLFGSTTRSTTANQTSALTTRATQAANNGGTLSTSSLSGMGTTGGGGRTTTP